MISDKIKELSHEERKMLQETYWRTMALSTSVNAETMQGMAYVWASVPAIRLFYDNKEDRITAYKRHFTLFNTTPTVGGFVTGLTASMEKEASRDKDFDVSSIPAVKTALMGPLAGIGDSLFWGSVRTIATGIGLGFATNGSILGPIVMLVIYNLVCHLARYYGPFIGYIYGSELLINMSQSGILSKVTKYATIVGMMTVGAMTCTMVGFKFGAVFQTGGSELALQSIFDGIMPNLVPLLLVLGVCRLLQKGVKSTVIIYAMLAIGIIGKVLKVI